jgi:hypothetical protein
MNTGQLDHLIDRDGYRANHLLQARLQDLQRPQPDGAWIDAPGTLRIEPEQGLRIDLEGVHHEPRIELSLDIAGRYTLTFLRSSKDVGRLELQPPKGRAKMWVAQKQVPATACQQGYDEIWLQTSSRNWRHSIGHLSLKEH